MIEKPPPSGARSIPPPSTTSRTSRRSLPAHALRALENEPPTSWTARSVPWKIAVSGRPSSTASATTEPSGKRRLSRSGSPPASSPSGAAAAGTIVASGPIRLPLTSRLFGSITA